jgi:hypothetical protein
LSAHESPKGSEDQKQAWRGLLRAGGFSFLLAGIILVLDTLLSASLTTTVIVSQFQTVFGVPPSVTTVTSVVGVTSNPPANSTLDVDLRYFAAHATTMQIDFLLAAIAAALLIPAILALYIALRSSGRAPALIGLAFGLVGIVASLTALPNSISVIRLSQLYVGTTSATLQAGFLAGAVSSANTGVGAGILGSFMLDIAIIIAGYLMTKGTRFGKATAYLGIFAGAVGIPSLFLPYSLSLVGSVLSLFGLIWIVVVGVGVFRLSSATSAQLEGI